MKRISCIFLTVTTTILSTSLFAQTNSFQQKLKEVIGDKKADVGVSVWFPGDKKSVSVNADRHYPMQSVYKFHLALAVLDQVDKGKLTLDQQIPIKRAELNQDTWSPLRDKHPEADFTLSIAELLKFTVSLSDNNGCDILFHLLGGTSEVNKYIHKLGVKDVAIAGTEQEMYEDQKMQFRNWSTPESANLLLRKFLKGEVLSKTSTDFLMKVMEETTTGPNKLKGLLPAGTVVAHKTGYSGRNKKTGITAATNDIGIMTLPDGKKVLISVFISMSEMIEKENEKLTAELAKAAWDEALKR